MNVDLESIVVEAPRLFTAGVFGEVVAGFEQTHVTGDISPNRNKTAKPVCVRHAKNHSTHYFASSSHYAIDRIMYTLAVPSLASANHPL